MAHTLSASDSGPTARKAKSDFLSVLLKFLASILGCVFQLLYRFHHHPPGLSQYMPISIDYTRDDTFDLL
jgi:hypothetical protein